MSIKKTELYDALLPMLEEHLSIEVEEGGFTDTNGRTIKLVWRQGRSVRVISQCTIDIKNRPEYEG